MDFSPTLTRVEAYFPTFDQAKQASVSLLNFDLVDEYDINDTSIAGSYSIENGNGSMVEQGDRVLVSVEPPVSIGDINVETLSQKTPFKLTFTAPEDSIEQALEIVKNFGGSTVRPH
ncbi:MAG: hypothetical protein QHH02_02740 [Syntrophomonadaceae bacterium]|nr:hypothetical protein [Syntrophomonadaceae bacterium]